MLVKWFRKIGKLLRGGAQMREIVLGATLGLSLGMLPGFNLTVLLLILLFLILNANIGLFIPGLVIGKALSFALAPVTYEVGHFLLGVPPIRSGISLLVNSPGTTLLGFETYCVIGGLVLGIPIGLLLGWIAGKAVLKLRHEFATLKDDRPKIKKLAESKLVGFFMWLIFGKYKGKITEEQKTPLFRKGGIILIAIVVILVAVVELVLADKLLKVALEQGLARAVSAEVNVSACTLAPLNGELTVADLQVTNPEEPAKNLVDAKVLKGKINLLPLFSKRLVVDELQVSSVKTGTKRDKPGKVFVKPEKKKVEKPVEDRFLEILKDPKKVQEYLVRAQEVMEKIRKMKKKKEGKEVKEPVVDPSKERRRAEAMGYLKAKDRTLRKTVSRLHIKKLKVERVQLPEVGDKVLIGKSLSSDPHLEKVPMSIQLLEKDDQEMAFVQFNFHQLNVEHVIRLAVRDIEMGEAEFLSESLPFELKQGTATLKLDGSFTAERVDLPFSLDLANLKMTDLDKRLGMLQTALENTDELALKGRVSGDFLSPALKVDTSALAKSFQKGAENTLKNELQKRLEEEVGGNGLDKILPLGGDGEKKKDGDAKKGEDKEGDGGQRNPLNKLRQFF